MMYVAGGMFAAYCLYQAFIYDPVLAGLLLLGAFVGLLAAGAVAANKTGEGGCS